MPNDNDPKRLAEMEALPTSFGSFKPTGHVMIGLPTPDARQALTDALLAAGFAEGAVVPFSPKETLQEMSDMIDSASPLAGFGSEITMMRRYLDESRRGTCWLLLAADAADELETVRSQASAHGARLAVSYRTLVIEELI